MDSLSTLEIPAIGYGIRYEFGIFSQVIQDGWQVEIADKWLRLGDPWEISRPEASVEVNFCYTEAYTDDQGCYRVRWIPAQVVNGVPCDMTILGYSVNTANTLRLWKAEARESFSFQEFNVGDYYGAVHDKVVTENSQKFCIRTMNPLKANNYVWRTIFLRVLFLAGHYPYSPAQGKEPDRLPRNVCRATE